MKLADMLERVSCNNEVRVLQKVIRYSDEGYPILDEIQHDVEKFTENELETQVVLIRTVLDDTIDIYLEGYEVT